MDSNLLRSCLRAILSLVPIFPPTSTGHPRHHFQSGSLSYRIRFWFRRCLRRLEIEVRDYEFELAQMRRQGKFLRWFMIGGNVVCGLLFFAGAVFLSRPMQSRLVEAALGAVCLLIAAFVSRVKL